MSREAGAQKGASTEIDATKSSASKPRKPSDVIYKDGFAFVTQKIHGDPPIRYLKCSMRISMHCLATARIPVGGNIGEFVSIKSDHNHPPDDSVRAKSEFMGLLKKLCSNKQSTVKQIFRTAAEIDPEGAKLTPFKNVEASMRKWQQSPSNNWCPQVIISDSKKDKKVRGKCRARKSPQVIIKDGFAYVHQKTLGDPPIRYLKCSKRNTARCLATGKMPLDGAVGTFVQIHADHNHPPDDALEAKTEFRGLLKRICCACPRESLTELYAMAQSAAPEGAALVPFKTIQSSMWKWRKSKNS